MDKKTKLLATLSLPLCLVLNSCSSPSPITKVSPTFVDYNAYVSQFDSFAGWCENKDTLDEENKATVKLLLTKAQTIDCQQAQQKLSGLRHLNLSSQGAINGTTLVSLAPLSNFTNLRELHLDNNKIRDLAPLSNLTNLRKLFINNNQISDITPLANLTNLQELYLMQNQIQDVSALGNLKNLHALVLENNRVVNVQPISHLTNLKTLDLDSNQITEISSLVTLTSLNEVYARNNPLTSRNCPVNRCTFSPPLIVRVICSWFYSFFPD